VNHFFNYKWIGEIDSLRGNLFAIKAFNDICVWQRDAILMCSILPVESSQPLLAIRCGMPLLFNPAVWFQHVGMGTREPA